MFCKRLFAHCGSTPYLHFASDADSIECAWEAEIGSAGPAARSVSLWKFWGSLVAAHHTRPDGEGLPHVQRVQQAGESIATNQSYLTPLIMLVVFPAVIGMLPGIELNNLMALIPVFNVSQLIKQIFLGEFSVTAFLVAFAANIVYAAIAFYVAVRIFKTEGALFRV
jgi:hypothetical protein